VETSLLRREFPAKRLWMAAASMFILALACSGMYAQTAHVASTLPGADPGSGLPMSLSLDRAIALALQNDTVYATNKADFGAALLDRKIARSSLLPQVALKNQYLYTQPSGLRNQTGQGIGDQAAPRFIANNAIREYASQAVVTETLSGAAFLDLTRTRATAAKASADLEISRRDLVLKVVTAYFGLIAANEKTRVAERASDEAKSFDDLTRKLAAGREVAPADVVKADLQVQQSVRDFDDARLVAEKARLDLAVLLFADPRMPYAVSDESNVPPLLTHADSEAEAERNNPDLRSANEALRISRAEVSAARAGYFPALTMAYAYGIDAPQFAVNGPAGVKNLGYSVQVSLDIPVWNWLSTQDRVRQSELRAKAAQVSLTNTQRILIAQFEEFYSEGKIAYDHLASLEQSAGTARESLRLSRLRYQAGEATALEVIDAQAALRLAETARAEGTTRYRVALANLQTLTGTL
jgi:outer membrane protein TolC